MTSLASVITSQQSEWVSFDDGLHLSATSQDHPVEPLERFLSSSETSSEGLQNLEAEFYTSEQAGMGDAVDKAAKDPAPVSLLENRLFPKSDIPSSFSTWVQFEDIPWTSTSPEHTQTASSPRKFCWTCPSFGSSGKQPLTSDSSWTTTSENTSSPSVTPSYTDLQSINTEDLTSGRASVADSTGSLLTLQVGGLSQAPQLPPPPPLIPPNLQAGKQSLLGHVAASSSTTHASPAGGWAGERNLLGHTDTSSSATHASPVGGQAGEWSLLGYVAASSGDTHASPAGGRAVLGRAAAFTTAANVP
ncbi:hypothetical protein JRQ81_001019, partial [Phrynocephalus forsythii]